jgi:single-strand DNA-binding protein
MAKSVNKVTLLGNTGKDIELKYTTGGTAVAKFSVATNERYKDKTGEWNDRTEWHNLVAFSKGAETLAEYVKKGDKLYVEGKLRTSSWDDKETGVKKYKTEIFVEEFTLLGSKHDAASGDHAQTEHHITDEDIPF